MSLKYILKDKIAYPCDDLMEWAIFMASEDRVVKQTTVPDSDCLVSTVFIGLNHQFGSGLPLLFETIVFTIDADTERLTVDDRFDMVRYSFYSDAEEGHENTVRKISALAADCKRLVSKMTF